VKRKREEKEVVKSKLMIKKDGDITNVSGIKTESW